MTNEHQRIVRGSQIAQALENPAVAPLVDAVIEHVTEQIMRLCQPGKEAEDRMELADRIGGMVEVLGLLGAEKQYVYQLAVRKATSELLQGEPERAQERANARPQPTTRGVR